MGDYDKASGLLKKLTQIMQGGEELGHPDRARAMQVLDAPASSCTAHHRRWERSLGLVATL